MKNESLKNVTSINDADQRSKQLGDALLISRLGSPDIYREASTRPTGGHSSENVSLGGGTKIGKADGGSEERRAIQFR